MNLRRRDSVDSLLDRLEILSPKENDLLVLRLPQGMEREYIDSVCSKLDALFKKSKVENSVLILPTTVSLEILEESDMNRLGWYRRHE